jgi:ribosome-binding factor A
MSSLLKSEISQILRVKVNEPRIGFISIIEVKCSKDLCHAWVYYSQIGTDAEKGATKKGLYAATKFIQSEIGKVMKSKMVPSLHFKFDASIEKGVDVVNKINSLNS